MADFYATVADWVGELEGGLETVFQQATNDMMLDASETATGVSRGGTLKVGYVPRADGGLAASLVSEINGAGVAEGENSYTAAVGRLTVGDTAAFYWTADYAMRMHYGFKGEDSLGRTYDQEGWFWVPDAVAGWQGYVDDAAAKVLARLL